MKDCHVCSGFRKLGASYCVSLKEHLNKTAVPPGGGPGLQAQPQAHCYVYMYICIWMCATAGAERAVPAPVRLHKVLGDSQSWVVVSGKERGP